MRTKKLLMIIISAVLLITVCLSVGISGVFSPYERQIRLGYKLLEQGNYEEAVLAFDKAVEIDVKRDKAYIGKAEVYAARCDENTLEDIKCVLETAYNQHYNDDNTVRAFIGLSDDLIAKDKVKVAADITDTMTIGGTHFVTKKVKTQKKFNDLFNDDCAISDAQLTSPSYSDFEVPDEDGYMRTDYDAYYAARDKTYKRVIKMYCNNFEEGYI